MTSSSSSTNTPSTSAGSAGPQRKSKHALAKMMLQTLEEVCATENVDRDEGVEALLTRCIQDMQDQRGSNFARDYLQFELSSLGSGGLYDVQKR